MSIQQMFLGAGGAGAFNPREHFDVRSGLTGPFTVNDINFEADLIVGKSTSDTEYWIWSDSVRGYDKSLKSNTNDGETSGTTYTSVGSSGYSSHNNRFSNGRTYTTWAWNAGSSTVTNTAGDHATTVRANLETGFSIVKFTVPSTSGLVAYGHGLATEPSLVITKRTDSSGNWMVFTDLTGSSNYFNLNTMADATSTESYFAKSDSTFSLQNGHYTDTGWDIISYCFAPVAGFSNFGTYSGGTNPKVITCGFEPTLVIIKKTDSSNHWLMIDSERGGTKKVALDQDVEENDLSTIGDATQNIVVFESDGFKLTTTNGPSNSSGGTYIYAAWA